jgi:16S rRNA (uracil1498-N3)-methyltransferase
VREERHRGKHERWEKIVFEAVKQSGRALIPTIAPVTRYEEVVGREGTKIIFDADHDADALPEIATATLLIGPEGGWSDEELQLARRTGCLFQRLGPRRLRAETAAIVAAARYNDI